MNTENANENWIYPGILFLLLFVSFVHGIGSIPLFDWDEGAFSEASREMVHSGNYLTTYMNGNLRFAKPILIYWLQSLSMILFGFTAFAARLPSVIAATFWSILLYVFVKRLYGKRQAFLATLFMITSLQVSIIARAAISDALLNLFIAGSLLFIFLYAIERKKFYIYFMYLMIGLGFLTKGPVAIFIPAVTSIIYFSIKKEFLKWFLAVLSPTGLIIFAAVAFPWYILEYMDQGEAFINGFFLKNNISRFNDSMEGHGGPFFYYIPVLVIGLLPFTGVLITAIIATFQDLKKNYSDLIQSNYATVIEKNASDLHVNGIQFYSIWFLVVFLFFSFSETKLPHYVIYGYTPLFILMSIYSHKVKNTLILYLPPFLFILFLFFIPDIINLSQSYINDVYALDVIKAFPENFNIIYRISIGIALLLFAILVYIPENAKIQIKMPAASLIFLIVINVILIPRVSDTLQLPVKKAAIYAKKNKLDVSVWRLYWPSFNFYSQQFTPVKLPVKNDIFLIKSNELHYFPDRKILYNNNGVVLIQVGEIFTDDYIKMWNR